MSAKPLESVLTGSRPPLLPSACLSQMPRRGGQGTRCAGVFLARDLQRRRMRWCRFHVCLVPCFQLKLGSGTFVPARPFPDLICPHWGTPEATVGGTAVRCKVMFHCVMQPVCDPFPESCLVEVRPRMSVIPKILGSWVDNDPEDIQRIQSGMHFLHSSFIM